MRLKIVVLPAPFGPIIVYTSPRFTSKLTLSTATTPPKWMPRFSTLKKLMRICTRSSAQPLRFHVALLAAEHALAVEREQLEPGAHLEPAAVQAARIAPTEAEHDPPQP